MKQTTKLFTTINGKLKQKKGETLTETLVALLIGSLALVLLASMVTSSTKIITTSEMQLIQYYEQNNRLEARASGDENAIASACCVDGTETTVRLVPGRDSVSIKCYVNQKANKTSVISY